MTASLATRIDQEDITKCVHSRGSADYFSVAVQDPSRVNLSLSFPGTRKRGGSVGNLRLLAADLGIGTLAPSHHQGGADTVKWSGSAEAGIQF